MGESATWRRRARDVGILREVITEADAALVGLRQDHAVADSAVTRHNEEVLRLEARRSRLVTEIQGAVQRNEAAADERRQLEQEAENGKQRIRELSALLERTGQVEEAAAAVATLDLELAELEARGRGLLEEQAPLEAKKARQEAAVASAHREKVRLGQEYASAVAAGQRLSEANVPVMEGELAAARAQAQAAGDAADDGKAEYDRLGPVEEEQEAARRRAEVLQGKVAEIARQEGFLGNLEDPESPLCTRCSLTEHARVAVAERSALEEELSKQLDVGSGAKERRQGALQAHWGAKRRKEEAEGRANALQARLAGLESDKRLAEKVADWAAGGATVAMEEEKAQRLLEGVGGDLVALSMRRSDVQREVDRVRQHRQEQAAIAAKAPELAAARATLTEASGRLEILEDTLRTPLESEPVPTTDELDQPLAQATAALAEAREALRACSGPLMEKEGERHRAQGELDSLGNPGMDIERLTQERAADQQSVADHRVLEHDLGREGLQALELEIAGPSVTPIANQLLEACFGGRFSIGLKTMAEKRGGGQKEVFELFLIDALTGRVGTDGSGGEGALMDRAFRLAIAVFNTQRSGFVFDTLYDDETSGYLDENKRLLYVAMLQKARVLGKFHRIVFITHDRRCSAAADARVICHDGQVTFDPPIAVTQAAA
jgi:exonuclease SbcC